MYLARTILSFSSSPSFLSSYPPAFPFPPVLHTFAWTATMVNLVWIALAAFTLDFTIFNILQWQDSSFSYWFKYLPKSTYDNFPLWLSKNNPKLKLKIESVCFSVFLKHVILTKNKLWASVTRMHSYFRVLKMWN